MKEIEEFYSTNEDFKEYVDRYAHKHAMLPEDALKTALIKDVYIYYKSNVKEVL